MFSSKLIASAALISTMALAAIDPEDANKKDVTQTYAGIVDFKEGDDFDELMQQYDYSVVSYYSSENRVVDAWMEGT